MHAFDAQRDATEITIPALPSGADPAAVFDGSPFDANDEWGQQGTGDLADGMTCYTAGRMLKLMP